MGATFNLKSLIQNKISPEKVALVLMLTFGLVFMFLIKPLQTPDEASHFIRAYELSEGKIFASKNTKKGCVLQNNQISYKSNLSESSMPKSVADFVDLNRDNYSERAQLKDSLSSSNQTAVCATQMEANSPIGYVPQIVAILLLRIINAPPILMDYLARFFILIVWTVLIYKAIKIIPVRKWAIVAIALLPISIQESISISADVLSIAPAVLFMAYVIRSYYEDRSRCIKRDLTAMTTLVTIAVLSKPVAIVLVLMIPFYYLHTSKKIFSKPNLLKLLAILAPIVFYLIWNILAAHHNASADDVFSLAEIKTQYFRNSHLSELKAFAKEAMNYVFYGLSLDQFASFKWFTVSVPEAFSYWGVAALTLILLVGYEDKKMLNKVSSKRVKWLNSATIVTGLGILAANIFTLFIIWTPLGSFGVQGVQFRYFLPVLMVLACIVGAKFLRSSERWYRNFVLINASGLFVISVLTLTHVMVTISY